MPVIGDYLSFFVMSDIAAISLFLVVNVALNTVALAIHKD
jgi:hypothetical protein